MTQKTKAQLATDLAANLANNSTGAITPTVMRTHLTDMSDSLVAETAFDANTILMATADNTPIALTVAASRVVGRKATGDIVALTPAELGNILAGGAYTEYTPTLTASSVDPTMGTGAAATGYYKQVGRRVFGYANIAFGTSAAAGTGNYGFLLPVTPADRNQPIGNGYVVDASDTAGRVILAALAVIPAYFAAATKKAVLLTSNAATDGFGDGSNPVGAATPVAFTDADSFTISFDYEAAADA